jgi:hypothetical protein
MTELLTPPAPNGSAPPPAATTRDFTRPRKRITFTIDDDTFEATPVLPGELLVEFVTAYNDTAKVESIAEHVALLKQALKFVLLPESYERFSARLKDRHNPIDDDQLADVVLWLLEQYGLRPTAPSQPSSDGSPSPESGTSSTESTQPEAPTSEASQPTGS